MKRVLTLLLTFVITLSLAGCLSFGEDIETTTPTPAQLAKCKSELYLNSKTTIQPLGLYLVGSGIDDALWFKFHSDAPTIQEIFDAKVIDTNKFETNYSFYTVNKQLK